MNGFIYKITNTINDKVYIGKTLSSIEKRFAEHKEDSRRAQEQVRPLYRAMNKYGQDNFSIEVVEECPIELLSNREVYWINFYHSYENGYNATLGGDGKQLYDYDAIVNGFLSGKLIRELAQEFECCTDTVSAALHLANIDTKTNAIKKTQKGLLAKDKNGNIIQSFASRKEAVEWLRENGYTQSDNIDNITATIGRAANGKRKSAYGFSWENI